MWRNGLPKAVTQQFGLVSFGWSLLCHFALSLGLMQRIRPSGLCTPPPSIYNNGFMATKTTSPGPWLTGVGKSSLNAIQLFYYRRRIRYISHSIQSNVITWLAVSKLT